MAPIKDHLQALIGAGLTQTDISKKSGVPQPTISRILAGTGDCLASTAAKLREVKVPRGKTKAVAEPIAA